MARQQEDGSIELADGRTVFADSLIQGQDLLEILDLVIPTYAPAPAWPFVSGGGGGGSGPQGPSGPAGTAGGAQGPQGLGGNQGNQGGNGPQGAQGAQGVSGGAGTQGNQGTGGPQGNQGNQGITGSGTQGAQGFQGEAGVGGQGAQGAQGFQGVDATGAQGFQGNQGISGPAGAGNGWTDDGTVVRLTTSTDNVSIGTAAAGGKLFIQGDTNEIQLQVRAVVGQTVPIVTFEDSGGTDIFNVTETGTAVPGSDSTRQVGTSSLRWLSMSATQFNVFAVAGDANPVLRLSNSGSIGLVLFGPGGASVLDTGLRRVAAAAVAVTDAAGTTDGTFRPIADNAGNVGTSSARYLAMSATQFNVFAVAGDANPVLRLSNSGSIGLVLFGPGGASVLDTGLRRVAAAAVAVTDAAGTTDGTFRPIADSAGNVGTSSARYAAMSATQFNVFAVAGDANPVIRLANSGSLGLLLFGPGGASALDAAITRQAASRISPTDAAGTTTGDFVPLVDNAGNVGTALLRWSLVRAVTITSGDLDLESFDKSKAWTIREGTEHLWAINRRNGKKYAIVLEEVDEVEGPGPGDVTEQIAA